MRTLFSGLCLLALLVQPSWAIWVPTPPALVVSSDVNTQTYTNPPRPVTCFTRAVGTYWDPAQQIDVSIDTPDGTECKQTTLSAGYDGWPAYDDAWMQSEAWSLYTRNANHAIAAAPEISAFVNTTSGAGRWFVLHGPPGGVWLRIDSALQGWLATYPDPYHSGSASMTHVVTFIASPAATLRERVIVVNKGIPPGNPTCDFGLDGTLPDDCFDNDGTSRAISLVVRSNPFLVETGVPFYIGATNGAAAGCDAPVGGYCSSTSDYESFLATSARLPGVAGLSALGFVVDGDGVAGTHDFVLLEDAGYSITGAAAPELISMSPNTAGEDGELTSYIRAVGLARTATARLAAAGEEDVEGVVEQVDSQGQWARVRFDLSQTSGPRDLVVVNDPARPADTTATLPAAVDVAARRAPEVRVDLVSPKVMELWDDITLRVRLTNLGNVDAKGTLVLDGFPKNSSWSLYEIPSYWTESVTASPSTSGKKALMFPSITVPPLVPVHVGLRLGTAGLSDTMDLKLVWEE